MKAVLAAVLMVTGAAALAEENSGLLELTTREELRGFEPVGRVDVEDGGFCTGALIAADLVLTAAHCVVNLDGSPVDAARIVFRAGFSHGTALAEASVARTIVDPGYRNIDPAPFDMVALDVALLQLAQPIPSAVISPFVVASPGTGDEVSVVSYAEDRAEALSWQRVCKVVGRKDAVIGFDCDVSFGSSGAPVLDRSGYRARIVSIISAGAEQDGKPISVGMELPVAVGRLKAALRSGKSLSVATPAATGEVAVRPGLAAPGMPGKPVRRLLPGDSAGTGIGARFVSP